MIEEQYMRYETNDTNKISWIMAIAISIIALVCIAIGYGLYIAWDAAFKSIIGG